MDKFIVTGNDFLSLPMINESSAAITDFTFLHMGFKGLIDVKGDEKEPFFKPLFIVDGNIKGEYNIDSTQSLRERERSLNNWLLEMGF